MTTRLVADDDPGWVRFWTAYGWKVAKRDARKAYAQLMPDAATLDAILAALAWQLPLWTRQGYGQPYPASYLRGLRWEDEPPHPPARLTDRTRRTVAGAEDFVRGDASLARRVVRLVGGTQGPDDEHGED